MNHRELTELLTPHYGMGESRAIVRILLEDKYGLQWTDVLCGATEKLSELEQTQLKEDAERLLKGEPVQYVIGSAAFYGRTFHVEPGVLIPRPETEDLIKLIPHSTESLHILDIGAGSGCIGITLALENPAWQVEAWDVSTEALRIAEENAKRLGATNITFRLVDILTYEATNERFDIIVSNPPYICNKEKSEMEQHVLDHEPHLALFVPDDDPLLFYRRISDLGRVLLNEKGKLFFEINQAYGNEVLQMMQQSDYKDITIHKDQFGKDRMATGRKE